uniref:Uncharacterized protein n=1 Tax=Ditylenchus dipsaci TaxID=166011 RepID=A0A915E9A9_9BILA
MPICHDRKHIFKLDIYKMMFSLGVAEVVGMIFTTGQAQAYFNIFGVVYCSDPLATTLAGTIGMGKLI